MSLSRGEDTNDLLRKWNHFDQEEKILIYEYQETSMGEDLNLQAMIVRGGRDEKIYNQVGTIYEGIIMANDITRQSDSLAIQDKEGMDKIMYRALSYRPVIKAELQTTMEIVNKINQYQRVRWSP